MCGCKDPNDLFTPRLTAARPRAGLFFMATEPAMKRAIAFVDGQNLYHAAKASFGYNYPNYDILGSSTFVMGS